MPGAVNTQTIPAAHLARADYYRRTSYLRCTPMSPTSADLCPVAISKRDRFFVICSPMIPRLAKSIASTLPASFDPADLEQVGMVMLLEIWPAVESYVRKRIKGAMVNCARGASYKDATHEDVAGLEESPDTARSVLARLIDEETAVAIRDSVQRLPADQARVIEARFGDVERGPRGNSNKRAKAGRPKKADQVAEGIAIGSLRVMARAA